MSKQYPVHPIPHQVFDENDVVYIVAGGPSLRDFSWGRLPEKKVIAINKALYTCPFAKILFWADYRMWEEHGEAIRNHAARYKVTGYSDHVRFHYPEDIYAYRFTRLRGYDDSPAGLCTGNNSGYSSINLAVKLGARRLVLLGYDFSYDEHGRTHWHEGHFLPDGSPRPHRIETLTYKMLPNFDSLVIPLQERRVSVYNANPDSNLKVWPRITIDEALALA